MSSGPIRSKPSFRNVIFLSLGEANIAPMDGASENGWQKANSAGSQMRNQGRLKTEE